LLKKALNLAMLDAKSRFRAATKSCEQGKWKVLSVREEAQMSICQWRALSGTSQKLQAQARIVAPIILRSKD